MITNRFTLRCPVCGGENSSIAGGNITCFHCGDCGFVECMQVKKEDIEEYINIIANNIREFYEKYGTETDNEPFDP
jgi:transcription elongation factor Elf1